MKHQISIIIPILNEAECIAQSLQHIIDNSTQNNVSDIIIVDGGSSDNSKKIISKFKEVRLINSEKGRAKQMNLGAKHATGGILYFLHADSIPPKDFDQLIINEIQKGNNAGCFRMQFNSQHWWLHVASWLTQFNWRACRGGDQSQFITKKLFDEIGGYDENYIIYEDNILIDALYARKEFVVINKKLYTSERMYRKHGIWKLQFHYWAIYIKSWLGADANELFLYYKKHLLPNH